MNKKRRDLEGEIRTLKKAYKKYFQKASNDCCDYEKENTFSMSQSANYYKQKLGALRVIIADRFSAIFS